MAKSRNSQNRRLKPVLLISAEGRNKTEWQYFQNFEKFSVRKAAGRSTDPENLMSDLIRDYKKYGLTDLDWGCCLVDSDDRPEKYAQIKVAQRMASPFPNILTIVSSPCFEVWFICHFGAYSGSYGNNDEVISHLRKFISDYAKNSDIYHRLYGINGQDFESKIQFAYENAMKLKNACESSGIKPGSLAFSPMTDVGSLMLNLNLVTGRPKK